MYTKHRQNKETEVITKETEFIYKRLNSKNKRTVRKRYKNKRTINGITNYSGFLDQV